jgi:hypothetical protein
MTVMVGDDSNVIGKWSPSMVTMVLVPLPPLLIRRVFRGKSPCSSPPPTLPRTLQEEKMEKMLRVANMEANKAANMVNYSDDISARPARTWFQSEDMKKALKETSRDAKVSYYIVYIWGTMFIRVCRM